METADQGRYQQVRESLLQLSLLRGRIHHTMKQKRESLNIVEWRQRALTDYSSPKMSQLNYIPQ